MIFRISPSSALHRGSVRLLLAAVFAFSAFILLWSGTQHDAHAQDDRLLRHDQSKRTTTSRIALVIGNGAYQHATPLRNPANDAALLSATLEKLNFRVTVVADKTQREMKRL